MEKGDYVLATKYSDGDPLDSWAVGFYDGELEKHKYDLRHMVVDNEGKQFRGNGFRRVGKINHDCGMALIRNIDYIEQVNYNVWYWRYHFKKLPPTSKES